MYKYYRHCIFLCFFNHFKMGLWEIKLYTKDKNRMKKGNKEWAEINCLKNIQRDKMTYLVLDSIIYTVAYFYITIIQWKIMKYMCTKFVLCTLA